MTPHRRRRALAAIGVTALLVLSACGDDDDDADVGDTTTTEEQASDATGQEADDDPTDDGTEATEPDDADDGDDDAGPADLEALLLTVDDLPAGWEEEPADDSDDDDAMSDDEGFCEGQPVSGFAEPPADAERDFTRSDEGDISFSTIGSTAGRFDGDGAEAFMDAVRGEVARCQDQPSGNSFITDGTTLTELDGIGDEALALETSEEGATFGLYLARQGDVVMFVVVFAEEGAADGEALLRTMADRA